MNTIHLEIEGNSVYPVSIEVYAGDEDELVYFSILGWNISAPFPSIRVHYSNGSSQVYDVDGGYETLALLEGPGILTYIRKDRYGKYDRHYYTYTENGTTTPEKVLISYYDD